MMLAAFYTSVAMLANFWVKYFMEKSERIQITAPVSVHHLEFRLKLI